MTLHELLYEIKSLRERLDTRATYTSLLIVAVGLSSFGLGRLSRLEEARIPVRIEQTASALSPEAKEATPMSVGTGVADSSVKDKGLTIKDSDAPTSGGQLVASKTGAKYHFPWCSGAKRISEANKLWFNSVEEARKAGYTPASNCKGLK
jgi:hypothetical protein